MAQACQESPRSELIKKLIPALRKRGIRLAVIKHTSHHHELDKPGKDSHRLRQAGAEAVVVSSPKMVALFREVEREWPVARLLDHLPRKVDLVIAEFLMENLLWKAKPHVIPQESFLKSRESLVPKKMLSV